MGKSSVVRFAGREEPTELLTELLRQGVRDLIR